MWILNCTLVTGPVKVKDEPAGPYLPLKQLVKLPVVSTPPDWVTISPTSHLWGREGSLFYFLNHFFFQVAYRINSHLMLLLPKWLLLPHHLQRSLLTFPASKREDIHVSRLSLSPLGDPIQFHGLLPWQTNLYGSWSPHSARPPASNFH